MYCRYRLTFLVWGISSAGFRLKKLKSSLSSRSSFESAKSESHFSHQAKKGLVLWERAQEDSYRDKSLRSIEQRSLNPIRDYWSFQGFWEHALPLISSAPTTSVELQIDQLRRPQPNLSTSWSQQAPKTLFPKVPPRQLYDLWFHYHFLFLRASKALQQLYSSLEYTPFNWILSTQSKYPLTKASNEWLS